MIKKILCAVSVAAVLGATSLLFADGMKYIECDYLTADAETAVIVAAGKDTSQNIGFELQSASPDDQAKFPTAMMIETTYASDNDSINVKVHMDVSDDGSNWLAWRTAAEDSTVVSGTADDYRVVDVTLTNIPQCRYCRLRLVGAHASGDTVNVSQTVRFWY